MPARRDGIPVLIESAKARRLEQLSLQDRKIDETKWLQQKLYDFPELLPIGEIDPSFAPLIPIGREVGTPVGPIDNLYVSPQGLLTIVEAKLWRNPQARREVLGQILDYAKEISRWSYDDLDARAKEKAHKSLWDLVAASETIEEANFIDAVSRNMRLGRFLLLIVGDGIREEMESLARFLQESPQLRFTLGLVELQVYKLEENLLVVPSVVARTIEITRAVVHVESTGTAKVDVSVDIVDEKKDESEDRRRVVAADEFFDELIRSKGPAVADAARRLHDDFASDARFEIDWKSGSYVLKLRDPSNPSNLFTILVVQRSGTAYVSWLDDQLAKVGLPPNWVIQYFGDTARLFGRANTPKYGTWDKPVPLTDIAKNYAEFKALIERFAAQVYSARKSDSSSP